jgi:ketosteroid isomerase-like protein
MSQENMEIVRRGIEQFNRQFTSTEKLDLDFWASDVVLDTSNAVFDAAIFRGHVGLREYLAWVRGMWKLQQLEAQEFIPVDEDRVIVPVRLVSVGRDSLEIAARGAALITVADGKITHMKAFQSKTDALKAAGMSEQDISS